MQAYSNVYERYFDPDHFSPGSPKTASRELPQACAYRALMSLKFKYHQDSRQPKDMNDLPTSAPLFDQKELTERAEQVMKDWTRRYPSQVAGTSDDVAVETKRQADQLYKLWSTKRNSFSSQEAMPPLSAPVQQENSTKRHDSLPLSKLEQPYHTPQQDVSPAVPENDNMNNERPPTESPDYDPGPKKSTLAAAAAAGVIGGGGGAMAAHELANKNNDTSQQSNDTSSQQQAPDSPDNDPVRVPSESQPSASRPAGAATPSASQEQPSTSNAAAAAGAQQPQPNVDKKIKISENDKERAKTKNSNDGESDDDDKPKNTGGTKDHIAEQPLMTEKGGLSGTQPVGKIDLKNL